jgi:NitT/TauT family transport system ATP-binding protein
MSVPVSCAGLAKTYPGGIDAVAPLDLDIAPRGTTAFVGPSGCGKSTILRMIAGLEAPSAGTVRIDGAPPEATLRKAGLALAFQDPSLLPWRSVRGNVTLALDLAGQRRSPEEVDQLIRLVGLDGFADTKPAALSGGMRQRAAIARALSTEPALLLLDEPFGAVDALTRKQLARDLPDLWRARGATAILVTHSVGEAVALADRVVVFSPRPARIIADIAVDLPDRGRRDPVRDPAFADLVDAVTDALSQGMAETLPRAAQ